MTRAAVRATTAVIVTVTVMTAAARAAVRLLPITSRRYVTFKLLTIPLKRLEVGLQYAHK